MPTNPTESGVQQALALYREKGCDGVVAFGGGSPIDLAKGGSISALVTDRTRIELAGECDKGDRHGRRHSRRVRHGGKAARHGLGGHVPPRRRFGRWKRHHALL